MDRWFVAAAYYIFASRHHSGQWSKGYAKLSQLSSMGFSPGPIASWEKTKGSERAQCRRCFTLEAQA
jgi:hypothetical protein